MDRYVTIACVFVIGLVALAYGPGVVNYVDNNVQFPWETPTTTVPTTTPPVTGEQVDLFLMLLHSTDQGAPAATPVNFYDSNKVFVGSWSSSSGLVTVTQKMIAGTPMFFQVRATAPASATYVTYTSALIPFVVPHGDVNGDAYIQIAPFLIHETSTSAATFAITDQGGATINTEATQYVNTTDTSLNVLVSITTNCDYGTPEDFTDQATGFHYLAGVFFVVKCTATQGFTNSVAHFYSSSLHWYVFNMPMIVYSTNMGYLTDRTFMLDTGTDTFAVSADFDFDLYDMCKALNYASIDENSFINGDSDLNPTAVANKVV